MSEHLEKLKKEMYNDLETVLDALHTQFGPDTAQLAICIYHMNIIMEYTHALVSTIKALDPKTDESDAVIASALDQVMGFIINAADIQEEHYNAANKSADAMSSYTRAMRVAMAN